MTPEHACELIRHVTYKPGWTFVAIPYPAYQDTVMLNVAFDAPNTDVEHAPRYAQVLPQRQKFYLHVAGCATPLDLWDVLVECVLHLELHELTEFFAVDHEYHKPYHRHTTEGLRNWLTRRPPTTQGDLADVTILVPSLR